MLTQSKVAMSSVHASPLRRMSTCKVLHRHMPTRPIGFSRRLGMDMSHVAVGRRVSRPQTAAAVASPAQTSKPEADVEVEEVTVQKLSESVYLLRNNCRGRLKYEVEFGLKRGTTDNCYLVRGQGTESAILIDIPFKAYTDKFVSQLSQLVPPSKLSHIVLTQLDPSNIPSLEKVLQLATTARNGPPLNLVLTNPAKNVFQSAFESTPERAALLAAVQVVVARQGTTVPLPASAAAAPAGGDAAVEVLRCVPTPTPRWPDMMCVYHAKEQLLFTSKLFSAHVEPKMATGEDESYDLSEWDVYAGDWRFFFDCMLAPVARQLALTLDRLEINVAQRSAPSTAPRGTPDWLGGFVGTWNKAIYRLSNPKKLPKSGAKALPTATSPAPAPAAVPEAAAAAPSVKERVTVSQLLPMHGPLIRNHVAQLLREYYSWTVNQVKAADTSNVAVFYASAYGNTAAIAQALSLGITKSGIAVNTVNLEEASVADVEAAIREADGFTLGSPTLGGHMPTQVQVAMGSIIRDPRTKALPCGVFGSFGWSGEAVDEMEGKLKDAGFKFAFDPIRVKFKPTARDLQVCEESGRNLALAVKKKMKAEEASVGSTPRAVLANGSQLAMGRVVGSLCVLTAQDEDAGSAMLASWISQASFEPPGLTVAVKKDRAMEPLLLVGKKFTLSVIPEGADKAVMKKLARPFAAGVDRLEGLETTPSPDTGNQIIATANAYLDCQVASRMEAGDHWVIYASVIGGKTLNNITTAVHHRKVGNHY